MSRKWAYAAGAVALGWYFRDALFSSAKGGVDFMTDLVGAGKRLSSSTRDDAGIVVEDPEELREQAATASGLGSELTSDTYALARMVRSEAGSADLTTKVRLACVAINQARALGWSPYDVIVYHKSGSRDGRYGSQITGRFASGSDPYEIDVKAAVLAQQNDITNGATNFAHQNAFGKQLGTASSIQPFVDTLAQEGKVPGYFPPDSNLIFFWRDSVPSGAKEGLG